MNKLKLFKLYILTTSVSFSFVILLQTLLFHLSNRSMNNELIIIIFVACVIVNIFINITHYFELSEWLTNLISIVEIIGTIMIVNFTVGYTKSIFVLENFVGVVIVSVTVYFFVMGIVFFKNSADANKINEKLKRNRQCN